MSSKPFVEKLKPDFKLIVNDTPVLCFKSKCLELSELISEYLGKSPKDPNSYSIKIPYVTVENDYLLLKEIFTNFTEQSFVVNEINSKFLFNISETFKIKSLEIAVNNYLDDKLTISRSFEKDEGCYLMKRIESILVDLTKEKINDSKQKIDTILILPPEKDTVNYGFRIDKILFSQILFDIMTSLTEKADLYIELIEKLRDSKEIIQKVHDIFIEKIQEKRKKITNFKKQNQNKSHHNVNEYHSFYLPQGFCFILRKFIKKNWFSAVEISEYDFFSPIMSDCVSNVNRYELSKLFHNYSENIERMKQNNWKYHNMYCNIGHNEDPLMSIIRNDEIESFKFIVKTKKPPKFNVKLKKPFNFARTVYHSAFERCDFVNNDCELIEYAAFFGAVKIFEYILDNLEIIPKYLTRYVIAGGNQEIVRICEMRSLTFYDCLDVAIYFHHWNLFEWLCENKHQDINHEELLEDVFANSNFRTLLLLLGKGINFRKFLVWSLKYKQYVFVDFYLSLNLKSNYLNQYDEKTGMTPLHFCCLNGYDSILLKLIKMKGIDLKLISKKDKMSILHYCCMNGSKHLCQDIVFLDDIDVNLVNNVGKTPLHIACENGFVEIVDLLLQREDINLNIKSIEDKTPLHLACENGSLEIFQKIMAKGDIVKYDLNGEISILQSSCLSKNLELVKAAAAVSMQDFTYSTATTMTPLSNACSKGSIEIVKYLIEEKQIDYNQANLIGQIPLNLACKNGQEEIVFYLFQLPKIILTGESLVLATSFNHINIIKKILSFDENVFPFVDFGLQALCIACKKGYFDIVELLVNSGKVELNPKSDKMGPLHYACQYGYPDIVRLLIQNPKVDINLFSSEEVDKYISMTPDKIPNPHHMSPLHFAIKGNNTEAARLLLEDPRIDVNAKAHGILF